MCVYMVIVGFDGGKLREREREREREKERERERKRERERDSARNIKQKLIVKPTEEVVDIKVWCHNRYGVFTCQC